MLLLYPGELYRLLGASSLSIIGILNAMYHISLWSMLFNQFVEYRKQNQMTTYLHEIIESYNI
jgi:hypothetical protein